MNYCARIGSHFVESDYPYIVYGSATGIMAGADTLEEAQRLCEAGRASYRERGRDLDTAVFVWNEDHWLLCGSLYELDSAPIHMSAP